MMGDAERDYCMADVEQTIKIIDEKITEALNHGSLDILKVLGELRKNLTESLLHQIKIRDRKASNQAEILRVHQNIEALNEQSKRIEEEQRLIDQIGRSYFRNCYSFKNYYNGGDKTNG